MSRYLIIGGGPAAFYALRAIRSVDQDGSVTVICDDPNFFYFRSGIPSLILQKLEKEQMPLASTAVLKNLNVDLIHDMARSIDFEEKNVTTLGGRIIEYDKLLLATGATAKIPKFFGRELLGVKTIRNLADAHFVATNMGRDSRIVVVGAGPLGLSMAKCAALFGANVTMIVREDYVGAPMIDSSGSKIVEKTMKKLGVIIRFKQEPVECFGDGGRLIELRTSENDIYPCALCIVCTGVSPNLELTYRTSIEIGEGILVDERMKTSLDDVFAAGDVCQMRESPKGHNAISRHWADGAGQGWTAGLNMTGKDEKYAPGPYCNIGELGDTPYAFYGQYLGNDPDYEIVDQKKDSSLKRLVFHGDRLVGAMILGETKRYDYLLPLIAKKASLKKDSDKVFKVDFDPRNY